MSVAGKLLLEWDYAKNGDPELYSSRSHKKVWWICKNGASEASGVGRVACGCHRWEVEVYRRSDGAGCPYCAGYKTCIHDSILYTHTDLCEEWDYENNDIDPGKVGYGCQKKVSWICKSAACGCHRWDAQIYRRTLGDGCPYCAGRKICIHDSILYTHPELAKEWDPRNTIKPEEVGAGSNKVVSWVCKSEAGACGCHVWESRVNNRTIGNNGCPYCSRRKACVHSSLSSLYPHLMKEWDYSKNNVNPDEISPGSSARVHWICERGHKWTTILRQRTIQRSGCKMCRCSSLRSLKVTHPNLADEWDIQDNELNLNEVKAKDNHVVSWICKAKGHKWRDSIPNRVDGAGCPYCFSQEEVNTVYDELMYWNGCSYWDI